MKTFKKGDIVTNDRYAAMGKSFTYVEYHKTARGGDSHEVRNSGGMPDFFGDDAGLYVVNPAPATYKEGDRVEHTDNAPGFVGTITDGPWTSGMAQVEWQDGRVRTEQVKFLVPERDKTVKAGDLIGHFGGAHIHFETHNGPTVKAAFTEPIRPEWQAVEGRSGGTDRVHFKTRTRTLHEAGNLIDGDRANDYDTKDDATGNFNRIAKLWEPILGTDITATQVALCLTQLKVARIIVNPTKADSWIDAAGYIALGSEIAEQEASNPNP